MMPHAGQLGFLVPVIMGNIDFAADNGLDPVALAGRIEVGSAVEIAMISYGSRGHSEIHGAGAQVVEANSSVEQAIFRMAMQMNELRHK